MTAPTTPELPQVVIDKARRLSELYPGAVIEIEPTWFVRAVRPIPTSNVGHTMTVDVRMVKDETITWRPT